MAPGPQRSAKTTSMLRHVDNHKQVQRLLPVGPGAVNIDNDVDMLTDEDLGPEKTPSALQLRPTGLGGGRYHPKGNSIKRPRKKAASQKKPASAAERGQTSGTNVQAAPRDWIIDIYDPEVIRHNARHLYLELPAQEIPMEDPEDPYLASTPPPRVKRESFWTGPTQPLPQIGANRKKTVGNRAGSTVRALSVIPEAPTSTLMGHPKGHDINPACHLQQPQLPAPIIKSSPVIQPTPIIQPSPVPQAETHPKIPERRPVPVQGPLRQIQYHRRPTLLTAVRNTTGLAGPSKEVLRFQY